MIGIINYGMGNLRSVQKAFERVGAQAKLLDNPEQLDQVRHAVLPGVGAFGDAMDHLNGGGWVEPIRSFITSDRPFLGICLGMQLLFDGSEEGATEPGSLIAGLSVVSGRVVAFQPGRSLGQRLKIPHMGWNAIRWSREDPLLAGLSQGAAVYFVHGYYACPSDAACVSASCDYAGDFCATIQRGRLWATQFHPEKSQRVGLKILANFAGV